MFDPNIELIECQKLYNILNEGIEYAKIGDPYYLYLLDCRTRNEYNESHILSAKNIKKDQNGNYFLPYEAELQSRNLIVVYDGNTKSLKEEGKASECANFLSASGSKYSVKILKGGYENFSKLYPFLRTQQIIYMPRELDNLLTYPSEIIPKLLYIGNFRHGTQQYIKKDLKLTSYVNCTKSLEKFKFEDENSIDYLKIPLDDRSDESVEEHLEKACNFIGVSRAAAICIAYLIYSEKISLQEAIKRVSDCKKIQPQINFLNQIEKKFIKN